MDCDIEVDRGRPSYIWRDGQASRMAMIASAAAIEGARVLDVGCGVGLYSTRLASAGASVTGSEIEWPRALEARASLASVVVARGEGLPFDDASFETVLLHEVLEHVADDRKTVEEVARVLTDGGRAVIFVPNRWWPFETHGVYWRGRYRFGNVPLVNYLPDPLRNALVPHARAYTTGTLRQLLAGLPIMVVDHRWVFPGFDRLTTTRPRLGRVARRACRLAERTPGRAAALSHLLVIERRRRKTAPGG